MKLGHCYMQNINMRLNEAWSAFALQGVAKLVLVF